MNREIRIIKRGARESVLAEKIDTPLTPGRNEPNEAPPLQIARTIKRWIIANNKRNHERLLAAQSFKRCIL
jgi:hypothetical protein